jgi:DNA polymerase III alpha subunit (gram-positive type)
MTNPFLCDLDMIWVDVETTGIEPVIHDIVEYTITRVASTGQIVATDSKKVRWERPANAQSEALQINGYVDSDDLPDPASVWQTLAQSGLLENGIIAGHNVHFDLSFFKETFKRHGLGVKLPYRLYDTSTLALLLLKPFLQSISLSQICVCLGVPVLAAHSSGGDVDMARGVDNACREIIASAQQADPAFGSLVQGRLQAWKDAGSPSVWVP